MSTVVMPMPATLLDAIRREFAQMPGMRLTRAQMRRLWQLDLEASESVVLALVSEGFLQEDSEGRVYRSRGAATPPSPPS
jgi:hypothetical protein